jgi:peptidyl-prolyl cis-trans isomerase D
VNHTKPPRPLAATLLFLATLCPCHAAPEAAQAPPAVAPAPAPAHGDDEVLAVVEGIPITRLQWDRLAGPYFQEVEARAGRPITEDERRLLRKNVLEELIRERLWVADAKRRGFVATEAELDARLQRNDYFKTNGKFDPLKFRQFKFSAESNYHLILEQVRSAVLLDKYVAWMRARYAVPEALLRKEFQSRTAQASLRYLWLTPDAISLEPQATAEQIRAYYEAHPDDFRSPEEARLAYVRVPVESSPGVSDSLHAAAEAKALLRAKAVIAALRAGQAPEKVSQEFGGLRDTGPFQVGEPIRGLGRSDALVAAVRSARPKQWLPEPIRVGPYFLVVRLEEHREPAPRSFRDAAGIAKRRADAGVQDAAIDSLARRDYAARPEAYRVAELRAEILARATDSFADPRPVSERDVQRTLERLRKRAGLPDTPRAWADSLVKTLPDLVRKERQLDLAFRTMAEALGRIRRGEQPEEVARRYGATLERVSIYQGQPPEEPSLLEGALLDSLYKTSPGTLAGPRVLRDSVFVARVTELNGRFEPPYAAVRPRARAEVLERRRQDVEREAQNFFEAHRDRYHTPQRWLFDFVVFHKMKPDSAPVPEDSIRVYYEQHPLEFTVPARARVRHILIAFRPGDGPGARTAARQRALDVLKRVKAGEDFEALAKEYSDDRGSAAQGGDLGEIARGQVVKEFGDAAFALKPGELSPVVETQFGFHIIRLDGMTPQKVRPLEDCRAEIHGVLGESLVDSLARSDAARFAERASRPDARFEDLAKAHGGAISSGPVGPRDPVPGIGAIPDMERAIGSLPEGGVSRPIPIEGGFLVARLARALPPRSATFGEVKEQAVLDTQAERRRMVADSLALVLEGELKAGKDLETLALPLGGLRLSRTFPRRGPVPDLVRDSLLVRDSTLYDEIFRSRPGTPLKPRSGSMGTLFAVVDSVTTLSPKQYAEHRDELREELFEQRTSAWTERLRSRAKIEIRSKELKTE